MNADLVRALQEERARPVPPPPPITDAQRRERESQRRLEEFMRKWDIT